jgi:hypothetical protein
MFISPVALFLLMMTIIVEKNTFCADGQKDCENIGNGIK